MRRESLTALKVLQSWDIQRRRECILLLKLILLFTLSRLSSRIAILILRWHL